MQGTCGILYGTVHVFFLVFFRKNVETDDLEGILRGLRRASPARELSMRNEARKKARRGKTWRSRGKEAGQRKSIVRLLIEKWGRFMGYRQTVLLPYSTSSTSLEWSASRYHFFSFPPPLLLVTRCLGPDLLHNRRFSSLKLTLELKIWFDHLVNVNLNVNDNVNVRNQYLSSFSIVKKF